MALTRERMQEAGRRKPKVEKVDHPAVVDYYGETVWLRVMGGTDRDSFEEGNYRQVGKEYKLALANARARFLVRCLCDEDGKRTLQDTDAIWLGQHDSAVLDILYDAARTLNGMGKEGEEDARKNSSAPNGEPGSALPAISG